MESTLREGTSFMKLDKAYKREIEETEKSLSTAISIGKQRLLEKKKELEKKDSNEEKAGSSE